MREGFDLADKSVLLGGAVGIAVGAAAVLMMRSSPTAEAAEPTCPPTMQAGQLDDLVMAFESWRDVRPYHLEGCLCPLCEEPAEGEAEEGACLSRTCSTPSPMMPFGSSLRSMSRISSSTESNMSRVSSTTAGGGSASARVDDADALTSKPSAGGLGADTTSAGQSGGGGGESEAVRKSQLSSDYSQSQIPLSQFGYRPYPNVHGRPFKVYAGFHMTRQARLWRSATMQRVIADGGSRPVGIPSEKGVTFDTIFRIMIEELGATVYVYGGVLRDVIMKGEHVADDIDVLFTCTVQALAAACEKRGWKEGDEKAGVKGDFYLKTDEKTGEKRFDYMSIGEGKEKFSGHTLDSNCAGEFAFNCMLYDVDKKILIDSSGWGLQDAAWNFLRIPYDGGHIDSDGKSQWELWSENCDRMPGMISLRFFNFRSRGMNASAQMIKHNVLWIQRQAAVDIAITVKTFLKRKVVKSGKGTAAADKKVATFKAAVVENFDSALGRGQGDKWWKECVEPIVLELRTKLVATE